MTVNRFSTRLLNWFDKHGRRDLPWQHDITPYRVWVSEIMLQQTQVTTVIPYFDRFMATFPTVESLAAASEDEILHHWTGLGYYARARNLLRTAKIVTNEMSGEFPETADQLAELPGIGRSTAGAIVSIAMNGRAPILDGNVKRVIARCFGIHGWPGETAVAKAMWAKAEALTPNERVGDYTQAIMDLGATICARSSPKCMLCPFEKDCEAKASDEIEQLPGRKPKKALPVRSTYMLLVENPEGEFLLEKRPSSGLWGGLWSFPECDESGLPKNHMCLGSFRHTFTHFHLDITPVHVKSDAYPENVSESGQQCWYDLDEPPEIGLTRPVTKLINTLKTISTSKAL
jgi:A/G-specific adenine glycosylase